MLIQWAVTVLALWTAVTQAEYEFPASTTARLLAGLRQRFSCSCVLLLYDESQHNNTWEMPHYLLTVSNRLGQEHIPSSSRPLQQSRGRLRCRNSRPLVVLLDTGVSSQNYLAEMSSQGGLKGPVWLLLLQSSSGPLEDWFQTVYVALDCQLLVARVNGALVTLTEVYQVARDSPLKADVFGSWEVQRGVPHWVTLGLYQRRNNLDGFRFRVASHEDLSLLSACEEDYTLDYCPLFTQTWALLRANMNCGMSVFQNPPDLQWGSKDANGSWTGQAGLVVRGEVDVAADWFTMTDQRLEDMDYTVPVLSSKLYVYIGHNGLRDLEWCNYLKPLDISVWLCVVGTTLLVSLCMPLLYHAGRRWGCSGLEPQCRNVWEALYCAFGALCQKGHDITPTGLPSRVLYLTWYVVTMVIMASYSASLISILTTVKETVPFSSFQELLDLGTYPLGMSLNSIYPDIFKSSKNSLLRRIYSELVSPFLSETPRNTSEREFKLCNSRYSFLASAVLESSMKTNASCNIVAVRDASFCETLAMLLPKGSPYKGIIDHQIHRLREVGVVKQMVLSIYPKWVDIVDNSFVQVEMVDVLPLFVIYGGGILVSIFILLLERNIERIRQHMQHLCLGKEPPRAKTVFQH